ncbi:MAG: 16S rRNA (cytidine(1402)-2'-O)-methyltransferase [Bacteroidia bacterium]|nr:MAG: 16S rRNA (cytidine(1402)-2'-O)-methyltransferase [Bacteroidia bacterium]
MSGLIIVPTPVGNLEDITLRAQRILREVDYVLTEDTRVTGKLLKHFDISVRMMTYHQHNEHKVLPGLMERLRSGIRFALVSDAGTPGISDAGFLLVRECVREGVPVEVLPGPTAFVPALVASGLPCDRFCFEGFLPVKKGRKSRLEGLAGETRTMVFYESPHRLLKTLISFADAFGPERQACVSREISKLHEEHVRGSLAELVDIFGQRSVKGEITIVVSGLVI